jgi:hypothetical protein
MTTNRTISNEACEVNNMNTSNIDRIVEYVNDRIAVTIAAYDRLIAGEELTDEESREYSRLCYHLDQYLMIDSDEQSDAAAIEILREIANRRYTTRSGLLDHTGSVRDAVSSAVINYVDALYADGYDEQYNRVLSIARRTAVYMDMPAEYRDGWLGDALNNAWREGMSDSEWLLAAGYIETVDEQTLLARTSPIRGGQTGEETIALVYPAGSQYQDLQGEPIPTEWHDEDELLRFVRERGVIVEVPIGR